jgi:phosphoserine phosphatase
MIIAAARRIHSSLTLGSVLDTFLDIAMGEIGAKGGIIYLRDATGTKLVLEHSHHPQKKRVSDEELCSDLAHQAAEQGELTIAPGEDGLVSIITLPLQDESKASIGVLQIYRNSNDALDAGDRLFLTELSHFASLSIKNSQYHGDSLDKARLDGEIGVAREIQMGTLPDVMPEVSGYDLVGLSRPAEATNGDSFDLIPSGEGDLTLLLADATGHGIGPALSVTQVRSMLRVAVRLDADLFDILKNINDQLCDDLASNRFVTAFIGHLRHDKHQLRYFSAGQGPLVLYRAGTGQCQMLEATCPPLGVLPMFKSPSPEEIDFEPGDTLALITDGVFEAENEEGQMFEKEAVAEIIKRTHHLSCAQTAHEILKGVDDYRGEVPQADDITIVLVRRDTSDVGQ